MSSFQLQAFDVILDGVRQAYQWLASLNIDARGTRLEKIAEQIEEIIQGIARADREEYFRGRNRRSDYWAIADGASFKEIWEQFYSLPSNRVPRRLLKEAIRGQALDPSEEQPGTGTENARNFQAQLEVASQISAKGIPITGFDDAEFEFHGTPFMVECKRISSPGQVSDNVKKADTQIRKKLAEHGRALIAIAPEKLLNLDEEEPRLISHGGRELEGIVRSLADNFYRENGHVFTDLDPRVIGIMLVLRFVCHDLSHGGYSIARYSAITPLYRGDHPDRVLAGALAERLVGRSH